MTDKKQSDEQAPFTAWLADQNHGRLNDELTSAFHDLIAAVKDTGKGGQLTLTVKVAPFRGEVDMLQVEDKVAVKVPEHDRKTTLWFPDGANNLHRNDPRQARFDFERAMSAQED